LKYKATHAERHWRTGVFMAAPVLLGFLFLVLYPIASVIRDSFTSYNPLSGESAFIGTDNYVRLIQDETAIEVAKNTLIFAMILVPVNMMLALFLAILLNLHFRGRTSFRAIFFSPVIVSTVAWTIVWKYILQDDGPLNYFLGNIGFDGANWLRDNPWPMISVVMVQVFKNVGLNMIFFLAALQGVPEEMYESSEIDGANRWQQFKKITLPFISPTILLVAILTIAGAFQVFAQVLLLTGGGPGLSTTVLTYYIFINAFQIFDLGYASALAVCLFVFVMILTVAQWQIRTRWVFREV
jgi:multiple sugar transport system permease protein